MSDKQIENLIDIINKLRDPEHGCPWAQQQTYDSLTTYIIEEAMEVVDAIVKGNAVELRDELGDMLFQIVFCAVIASEKQSFVFSDIVAAISDKLKRRNPHIFNPACAQAYAEATDKLAFVTKQWQDIKAIENPTKAIERRDLDSLAMARTRTIARLEQLNKSLDAKLADTISSDYSKLLESVLQLGRVLDRT